MSEDKLFSCVDCKDTGYAPQHITRLIESYYHDDKDYYSFSICVCDKCPMPEIQFRRLPSNKQEEIAKKHGIHPFVRWFMPERERE